MPSSINTLLTTGAPREISGPGEKFRLGPLVSGAPKSHDEQKKGHSVRRCSNFGPKSSDKQKKKVISSADDRISARNKKTSSRPQVVV